MTHSFRYLEDVAIADVAFEAVGDTLEEVFLACAEATFTVMVDPKSLENTVEKSIQVEAKDVEQLLFNFLEEIIFVKDTDALVFGDLDLSIKELDKGFVLDATLKGDPIDNSKQELETDVKAVTFHQFKLEKTEKGYVACVVLDI